MMFWWVLLVGLSHGRKVLASHANDGCVSVVHKTVGIHIGAEVNLAEYGGRKRPTRHRAPRRP